MLGVALVAAGLATGFGELRTRRAGSAVAEEELRRAVDGLRALAENSESLPLAAQTLAQTSTGLADLQTAWESAQADATRELVGVLRDAVLELRADMKVAVEENGAATRQAVEPIVADGVQRTARAATERLDSLLDAFSHELEMRREGERALADGLAARMEDATGVLREVGEQQRSAFESLASASEQSALRIESSAEARADALAARLEAMVESQAAGLAETGAAVGAALREATGSVAAGGAELSAAAQMFSESVDRHREAATTWLESLGQVEQAVEQAGQEAAADAVRGQLAATEEIFARQLRFQQALFEQVRELRRSGAAESTVNGALVDAGEGGADELGDHA
jgi:hypothetical protein